MLDVVAERAFYDELFESNPENEHIARGEGRRAEARKPMYRSVNCMQIIYHLGLSIEAKKHFTPQSCVGTTLRLLSGNSSP